MKKLFPIFLLVLSIYVYSCANQIIPTGGPKDTIPPTLIESQPPNKSVNYHDKTFKFYFDEDINVDKLKQALIITPLTENKYEVKSKKNTLTLIFEEAFDSLTTYTLNFGAGVTDIHEKTPAVNLSLAFSTGPIIDSIYVNGTVIDLYKNSPLEKMTIALFDNSDSLNILTGKPKYFALSDEDGFFQIENIKNGYYKIYAFDDKNNNMINNPEDEIHGFIQDSINLNTSLENLQLRLQLLDPRPLKFNRGKFTGTYFDLSYNKYVQNYSIIEYKNKRKLPIPKHNLVDDNTSIRFYHDPIFRYDKDSVAIIVSAYDSLKNNTLDTVFVKFRDSKRKPTTFETSITPKSGDKINSDLNIKLTFNKPIIHYSFDSIRFQYDTLIYSFIPDSLISWNDNQTELTIQSTLDPKFFKKHLDSLKLIHSDTSNRDSTEILIRTHLQKQDTSKVDFIIPASAFISAENDTTIAIKNSYLFKKPNDFGSIQGTIQTSYTSFTIQLITPNFKVVQQTDNSKKFHFKLVPPGKYTFRILIDENMDGKWNYGNFQQGRAPEPIYFYTETFDVRANWHIDNINISF